MCEAANPNRSSFQVAIALLEDQNIAFARREPVPVNSEEMIQPKEAKLFADTIKYC